jgi:SPP1 gp7 family putative phage head morphogenesis protein
MRFNLAQMAKRSGLRRSVTIRDIRPPAMFATNLFNAAYADVVKVWEEAAPRLIEEYRRSLSELTQDSLTDLEHIFAEAERQTGAIFFQLKPALERWSLFVERWYRQKWVAAVQSASRVDLSTMLGASDVRMSLETSIANNVALVRSVSDETRQKMSQAVFDGLRNRTPADEVAKRIRDVAGMGRARARRIASDQLAKLTSSLADERRRQAGLSEWEWLHSGKLHPREDHRARNGRVYSDDPGEVGGKINGKAITAPPNDRPGQLPFCGCRSRSVIAI